MNKIAIAAVISILTVTGCGGSSSDSESFSDSDKERLWKCIKDSRGGSDISQLSWWRRGECKDLMARAKAADSKMMRAR